MPTKVLDHHINGFERQTDSPHGRRFRQQLCHVLRRSISCWGRSYNGLYGNGDGSNSNLPALPSFMIRFDVIVRRKFIIGFVEAIPGREPLQSLDGVAASSSIPPCPPLFSSTHQTAYVVVRRVSCSTLNMGVFNHRWLWQPSEVILVASYTISQREGRVQSPLLLNASANDVFSPSSIRAIDLGQSRGCTIHSNEQLRCWGYGANGRLASGSTSNQNSPYLSNLIVSYAAPVDATFPRRPTLVRFG